MSSLLEIMDKKSCGKWYAYEQSAFYLSRMMLELSLDRYVMENALLEQRSICQILVWIRSKKMKKNFASERMFRFGNWRQTRR